MKTTRKLGKGTGFQSCLFSSVIVFFTASLHAQDADEEVYELSPFAVDSSEDTGYRANSTLAGTRLKTSLKDVGASISVATREFMEDIGATDLESLLPFTGGTEAPGINGNFQGANLFENQGQVREERTNARQQQNTRVRGLAAADLTTNLFVTDAPFDSYNIDRITINRGANAALFGLGSPGGVFDASYKRANFNNSVEIGTKHDEWGTARYTLDINRSLVEDKLALRLLALNEDIKWEQNGTYERDNRFHIDALFKPLQNTYIRAYYNEGEIRAARPMTSPPRDYVSSWVAAGQPLYDGTTARYYWSLSDYNNNNPISLEESNNILNGNGPGPAIFGGGEMTANGGSRLSVIFPDPTSPNPGGFNGSPQGMQTRLNNRAGNNDAWPGGATTQWYVPQDLRTVWRWPVGTLPGARGLADDEASFYNSPQVTDRGMFDYRSWLQSTPNKLEMGDLKAYNVSLEQTWLEGNAGIEIAIDDQEYSDNLIKYNRLNSLNVDMNISLADGTPNPNVGRAYLGGSGFAEPTNTTRETTRVTGFYQYDFADQSDDLGWLGKHVLTLNYSTSDVDSNLATHMPVTSGNDWQAFTEGREGQNIGGVNRTVFISYVGDSLVGNLDTSTYNIPGVSVIQRTDDVLTDVIAWNAAAAQSIDFGDTGRGNIATKFANMTRGASSFTMREHLDDPSQTWTWGGNGTFNEVDSQVAILQSFFANNNIVTTASWRWDDVTTFDYSTTGATGGLHSGYGPIPETPSQEISGVKTTGFSIVAHSPQELNNKLPGDMNLSAHFNTSSNFVATGTRLNIFGERQDPQQGDVKEFGISVRGLQNKIDVKFNYYESEQTNADVNPLGRPNNIWRDILENNTWDEINAAGIPSPGEGFLTAYEFELDGEREINTTQLIEGEEVLVPIMTTGEWNTRNPQQNAVQTMIGRTSSKGFEVEMTFNPTANWRFAVNGTRAESIRSDVATAEQQHIANRLQYWTDPNIGSQLFLKANRQVITRDEEDNILSIEPNYDSLIRDPRDGSLHQDILGLINTTSQLSVFDGLPAPEIREWRWNFITNYQFGDEGPAILKGFGVGGALRWESPVFLGTGLMRSPNGALIQNPNVQFEGSSTNRIDLWFTYRKRFEKLGMNWRTRIGASNINSNHGLLPVTANPDGSIGVWRVEAPTTWSWTNTFSF